MKKFATALAVISLLSVMPALPASFAIPTFTVSAAEIADNSDSIKADGFGTMPAGVPAGRAKLLARRAAIVDAQRNLVETINGTAVTAETNMENYIIKSDVVRTKVNGVITGARIVSEDITREGIYHVVMSVPMYGVRSVAEAAIPALLGPDYTPTPILEPSDSYEPATVPDVSAPVDTTAPSAPAAETPATDLGPAPTAVTAMNGGYTGLIIDARGANMIRAFGPNIFDTNGRTIYSVHNVDESYAIKYGIVSYAEGSDAWQKAETGQLSRVGSKPLIIRMTSPKQRHVYNCDVIISAADADRILAENQKTHFLENCAVTFEI